MTTARLPLRYGYSNVVLFNVLRVLLYGVLVVRTDGQNAIKPPSGE